MKKILGAIVAVVCLTCSATMSDEEALDVLRRVYLAEISIDRPPIPSHMTATNMPFEMAYSNLLRKTGWTARRCIDETCIMISNMCTKAETFEDGPLGYIYAGAVNAVGRHGDALAIPYINYAFDNVVTENAFDEAFALARLKGLGHAAFELYDSKRSSRRVEDLALAVRHFTINRNISESVTNRTVRFFLNIADGGRWETSLPDSVLCKMFPGYSTSSNRYEHIVSRIPTATSLNMSNELFAVKSELLALPPGTMQLLSTNQFYNVED